MTGRLPRLAAKDLIRILRKNGFVLFSSRGSHQHFVHPAKKMKVTIPVHAGKIIGPGLMKSILKQAEIDESEIRK